MLNKLKLKLFNWVVRDLYKGVVFEDVFNSKIPVTLYGRELSRTEIQSLGVEAATIQRLEVYKLVLKNLRRAASKQIFDKASSPETLIFGKAMLHSLNLFENGIKFFDNKKP